jgi:hypothetical protein
MFEFSLRETCIEPRPVDASRVISWCMMGRHSPDARTRLRAVPLVLFGVVVACGRIGFDDVDVDASVEDVRASPVDASMAMTSDTGTGEGAADEPEPVDANQPDDAQPADETSTADAQSGCATNCTNAHGTTSCVNSVCVPVCASGYADCDGDVANGCEANVEADPTHCGTCTKVCTVDSGSPICTNGVCGTSSCAAGTGDCDANAGNGCETNLNTSTANCRFCGNACTNANGSTSCVGGTCTPVCSGGFGDCDGNVTNGCETPVNTISNCGSCGHVCTSDAGTPTCSGSTCGTSCDLSGTWAAKVIVQLSWPSSLALATGSGTLDIWLLLTGTQSGNSLPSTLLPCEITIPDFPSSSVAGNELYGLTFPNALFDHSPAFLPTTPAAVTLSGSAPGSTVTVPPIAFLVGVTLANPTTAAWPSTPEMVTSNDVDQDIKTGVTTPYKSGGSYVSVPVNVTKSPRADNAYLASRVVTSMSGTLASCTSIAGTATVTNFDTHILGCELAGDAGTCTQADSDFTDNNRPAYVTGAATVNLVKIANGATCATVRAAL